MIYSFKYNREKNSQLLKDRGIGFDEIIEAIHDGNLLGVRDHYNKEKYPDQMILYVRILDEVYVIPCVQEKGGFLFLKTLFPSRKARKQFLMTQRLH